MNLKKYFDAANAAEARVQEIAAQINTHFEAGENEQALELRPKLDAAKAEAKGAHQLYLSMAAATTPDGDPAHRFIPMGGDPEPQHVRDLRASDEYRSQFFNALRAGATPKTIRSGHVPAEPYRLLLDALTETGGSPAGAEGGLLLPVDFDTMIGEYQRLAVDLAPYTAIEDVTTLAGWRAMEVGPAALPFAAITESDFPSGERIPAMESPTFTRVEYSVDKYGGYLPVAEDLLNDTPSNIMGYLARWCGRKKSLTNTSLVLAIVNALTPVSVTDPTTVFGSIKTVLNKTLDPAISASSAIFCNQSGLDLMDQLLDGNGRPYLQPDPTSATRLQFKGRQIVPVPTAQWGDTNTNTKTRIAVGDMAELISFFRRVAGEMSSTNIGGTAWRNDNVEIKYIMRADAVQVDAAAVKLLSVTLP
jgi:HK97 family phage major capsid protein